MKRVCFILGFLSLTSSVAGSSPHGMGEGKSLAHAFLFTAKDCALSRASLGRLSELSEKYAEGKVRFHIASTDGDTEALAKQYPKFAVHDDSKLELARLLGADRTGQVFLVDDSKTLLYVGLADGREGNGGDGRPPFPFLSRAIDEFLSGRGVRVAATLVQGKDISGKSHLTYNRDIAPILRAKCEGCHTEGGIQAQLSLSTFDKVEPMAQMMASQVGQRRMPPWPADRKASRPMANDIGLGDEELFKIVKWAQQGADQGDGQPPAANPLLPSGEWSLGQPDEVFVMEKTVDVPSDGLMDYVYLPNTLKEVDPKAADPEKRFAAIKIEEDRYLLWSEILPGAPEVVHHVIVYILPPENERVKDRGFLKEMVEAKGSKSVLHGLQKGIVRKKFGVKSANLDWFNELYGLDNNRISWEIGRYVPGENRAFFPKDFGVRVPKGSQLVFEMHYTTNGTATKDRTRIGVKWATSAPKYLVHTVPMGHHSLIDIPPHADNVTLQREHLFETESVILSVRPHAHLRGKSFRYELILPNGDTEQILSVPVWDFNTQPYYEFKEAIRVKPGTKVRLTGSYDNTINNHNLTEALAGKRVRFGLQSTDEMFFGYMNVAEALPEDQR